MLSKGRLDRIRDIAGAVGIWPEEREAINDLLVELAVLRPVVEAARAHAKQTGSCLVCLMEYDGGMQVHRHDCPLAALEVQGAE